jgi:hypothetical protein
MKPENTRIKSDECGFSRQKGFLLFFSGLIPVYPLNSHSLRTLFFVNSPLPRILVAGFSAFNYSPLHSPVVGVSDD